MSLLCPPHAAGGDLVTYWALLQGAQEPVSNFPSTSAPKPTVCYSELMLTALALEAAVPSADVAVFLGAHVSSSLGLYSLFLKTRFSSQTFHPHVHLKRKQHVLLLFQLQPFSFVFYKRDSDQMMKRTSAGK